MSREGGRGLIQLNSHDGEEREHSFSCIACCKLSDTQSEYELYKRTLRSTIENKTVHEGAENCSLVGKCQDSRIGKSSI